MTVPPRKKKTRDRTLIFKVLDRLVTYDHFTVEELSDELDIAYKTVERYLKELYVLNLVYICEWDRKYQHPVPVYRWGKERDKARPKTYTRAEIKKRYRDKNREELNAKRRAKAAERRRGNVSTGVHGGTQEKTA